MFQDAFEKLDLAETATLVDRLNPLFEGVSFDAVQTAIMSQEMLFYPGWRFLDMSDHAQMPALRRFVICGPKEAVVLDFTNAPIYKLNRDVPVKLNRETLPDYVRFFFAHVRGRHGRFLIAESVDDIPWREDPPPPARKAIGAMLEPLSVKNTGKTGPFSLDATMVFKDSLFKSKISVTAEGMVNLTDEELLVEDLPVLDDTFGQ